MIILNMISIVTFNKQNYLKHLPIFYLRAIEINVKSPAILTSKINSLNRLVTSLDIINFLIIKYNFHFTILL